MDDRSHDRLIGRTIAGKFVVEELLGTGAMGAVFRARQVALEKTVAIKVLHGEHAHDPMFVARFQREARAASRLNHPNSMQVIDFGAEPDGLLYIAMEYLHGLSLQRVIREQWPLPPTRIADILMQALAALAIAHDMGVVHRDLKPENIMVLGAVDDDGRAKDLVKVCDFGIAKITDPRAYGGGADGESNAPVTSAGFLIGTPEYMSPEQARGEKLDPRSDLYSMGVILFEMLTRRVPFEAENAIGVVLKHITEMPVRPSDLAPNVDRRLEAISLRALRKLPQERYRDAREMRADLRAAADGAALTVGSTGPIAAAPRVGAIAPTIGTGGGGTTQQATRDMALGTAVGDDTAPKPTFLGSSTTIPGSTSRRALVIVGTAIVALASAGGVTAVAMTLARSRALPAAISPAARVTALAPPAYLVAETPSADPAELPAESPALVPRGVAIGASRAPPRAAAQGTMALVGAAGKTPPLPAGPAAVAVAAAPPSIATAAPASLTSATPRAPPPLPPASPVVGPGPVTSAVAAPEPFDPSFEPERGFVEVGLIDAQGVRESAVRAALRGVGLARCYRVALRARGARVTGTATLSLSFDDLGSARSAIVTGADFLGGLTRCLQTVSAAVRVPPSHIDPIGATAEVILAFKAP